MKKQQYFIVLILALGAFSMADVDRNESVGMDKSRAESASEDRRESQRESDELRRGDDRREDLRAETREDLRERDRQKADDFRDLRSQVRIDGNRPDDVELRDRVDIDDDLSGPEEEVGGSMYRD